jgi:peroxiredoxin
MTKKLILAVVIVAALSGLVVLSRFEGEAPPPALPDGGPGGNPHGEDPSYQTEKIQAPDFTLADLQGNKVTLSELKGKVVILNFWSSHCPPCLMEIPSFIKLEAAMSGKQFRLLSITDDPPGTAKDVSEKLGINFTVLPDPDTNAAQAYGVYATPETFIIMPDGTINDRFMGAANWSDQSVIDYLNRLIERGQSPGKEL